MQLNDDILDRKNLRKTAIRKAVLKLFIEKDYALSHQDIENAFTNQFDRVTIYRTLNTFLENDVVKQIYDGSAQAKYALCEINQEEKHVHFKCNNCSKTFCLDELKTPIVAMPQGYNAEKSFFLVEGTCAMCNQ